MDGVAVWVDAVVTGVMVGSGTKPLHDLITRAQNGRRRRSGRPAVGPGRSAWPGPVARLDLPGPLPARRRA